MDVGSLWDETRVVHINKMSISSRGITYMSEHRETNTQDRQPRRSMDVLAWPRKECGFIWPTVKLYYSSGWRKYITILGELPGVYFSG